MNLSTTIFHVFQSLSVDSLTCIDFRNSMVGYLCTYAMQRRRCGQDEVQLFGGEGLIDLMLH